MQSAGPNPRVTQCLIGSVDQAKSYFASGPIKADRPRPLALVTGRSVVHRLDLRSRIRSPVSPADISRNREKKQRDDADKRPHQNAAAARRAALLRFAEEFAMVYAP